jgi:hypothetical protein
LPPSSLKIQKNRYYLNGNHASARPFEIFL